MNTKNSYLKVVIPMAGLGTRLRPHTWSKPKQLVSIAGKTVLDHVLESLNSIPDFDNIELVNIIGYLGDQIELHIEENYPQLKSHYIIQENPRGQSHAVLLAKELLHGPMLIIFADTLIETDFSFLASETADAIAWVKRVPDPRRFGVVELGNDDQVIRLIEKPSNMDNNLAVVGCYYFKEAEQLVSAIEEQIEQNLQLKNEFFLADAINIMLASGIKMITHQVDIWLDAGTPDSLLETNRFLLDHGHDNTEGAMKRTGTVIIPPVYIHPSASIHNTVIGPYVSLGMDCEVSDSIIKDSILEDQAHASDIILEHSLLGRRAQIHGTTTSINAGDDSQITF